MPAPNRWQQLVTLLHGGRLDFNAAKQLISEGAIVATHTTDASGNITGFAGLNGATLNYPRVFAQSSIPFILAGGTAGGSSNQFTMGNNGAISTLPVLPTTYSGGAWIYMPACSLLKFSMAHSQTLWAGKT